MAEVLHTLMSENSKFCLLRSSIVFPLQLGTVSSCQEYSVLGVAALNVLTSTIPFIARELHCVIPSLAIDIMSALYFQWRLLNCVCKVFMRRLFDCIGEAFLDTND